MSKTFPYKTPLVLVILILVQAFCTVFFASDLITDIIANGAAWGRHITIEAIAAAALVVAMIVETRVLLTLARRKARLEQSLQVAQSAVFDIIETCFADWKLSPAEWDVATFMVKGLSIDEIAEIRGNKPGTIKAHLNTIYRKSNSRNRAELMSNLIDTLMMEQPRKQG
ncbi:helix-turn-helix transcriptional regulator [Celeribacter sp.]|uniref:helix-turn-helix transcriptional regulator n=1 Tax=Celeribacter sp. TaxID=1890673 RepID=UPI003A8FA69F